MAATASTKPHTKAAFFSMANLTGVSSLLSCCGAIHVLQTTLHTLSAEL